MEHDDEARKDLLQVMKTFCKVTDTDGKRVGPPLKTMRSEFFLDRDNPCEKVSYA
jgi:hypothetical protein